MADRAETLSLILKTVGVDEAAKSLREASQGLRGFDVSAHASVRGAAALDVALKSAATSAKGIKSPPKIDVKGAVDPRLQVEMERLRKSTETPNA